METIRIEDLNFTYPTGDAPALSGIDLAIDAGSFVVVCGKSGCGKSTLLRQMKKGLVPYGSSSGRVLIDGVEVEAMDDRKSASQIGFVQQNPDHQIVTDKVWHELAFGLENLGLSHQLIRRRVAEMASFFGIHSWFRRDVSALSGGEKQMLNLASVMAMQPEVLILDEPASQLDPIAASDFLNTVARINRELGTTVILSEHRLEEVFPIADQVVVLDEGRILAKGSPREVGAILLGQESPHPMYYGLPEVMRAFPESFLSRDGKKWEVPLTIRDGRLLLADAFREGRPAVDAKENKAAELKAGKAERDFAIRAKEVYFRYQKDADDVLRSLALEIQKGELYCLLGGNGSGKTTMLKTLCGILKPQHGRIQIADGARIAMVPQNPQALFTEITVEEDIFAGMDLLDLSEEEKIRRTEALLSKMEILHLRKSNPYDLSGGEQQRLALAKVCAGGPDIMLLDEPTKGLDPFFKRTLGETLRELAKDGITILAVSHDVDFCARFADRCGLFFDGAITAEGRPRDFFTGNHYYTTTANRLARTYRDDIILCEEVNEWLRALP